MGILDDLFGTKKKPRPDFGNVQGGGSFTAPNAGSATPAAPTLPQPSGQLGERSYVVMRGDSLSKIAKREYGDANMWPRIYAANKATINDPNLIHPGQKLTIPKV